jgi:hypothetical protein
MGASVCALQASISCRGRPRPPDHEALSLTFCCRTFDGGRCGAGGNSRYCLCSNGKTAADLIEIAGFTPKDGAIPFAESPEPFAF